MTELQTLERPDIDEHDIAALDFEVPCAARDCEHVADWWNVCLACGAHTPLCEPHRRAQVLRAEACAAGMLVVCAECDAAAFAKDWRTLFSFVPIER